ncbi:MAG: metallophosphoesterase [Thermodesulfobacteriota bacterium]|nr:metallophosphoesterase [Thermodesulfobacteriota bacterium]
MTKARDTERGPFWIAVGDIHDNVSQIGNVPAIREAEAVLISGDITNRGSWGKAEALLNEVGQRNPKILAQIGNMDTRQVEGLLDEKGFNVHGRATDLGFGVGLVGVGYSTPSPFGTPSEVSERQMRVWLDQAMEEARDFEHLILMVHNPPFNTRTDRVWSGQPVGSRAVRQFIEKHQPHVCITGHIHESRAVDRLGRTQVINPGLFGTGAYVWVGLVGGKLEARLKSCAYERTASPLTSHAKPIIGHGQTA